VQAIINLRPTMSRVIGTYHKTAPTEWPRCCPPTEEALMSDDHNALQNVQAQELVGVMKHCAIEDASYDVMKVLRRFNTDDVRKSVLDNALRELGSKLTLSHGS
jgi:hypothetical protein